jgi:transposase
MAKKKTTSSC